MTVLLAIVMVVALGTWIPLAQALPGTPERTRLVYVAVGNVVFAGAALLVSGGGLTVGWRSFWLPLLGGVVWTGGNYCVFRASATIGLARAAGTWTPLNIVVAFVWGALLFGELDSFSALRFVVLGAAFVVVVVGVLLIAGARDTSRAPVPPPSSDGVATAPTGGTDRHGRGCSGRSAPESCGGRYFVPAQWAAVPAQQSNVPLALGILLGALALALPAREPSPARGGGRPAPSSAPGSCSASAT